MKKLFVLFATVTLLIGVQACKQKEEEAATEEVTTEVAVPVDTPQTIDTTRLPVVPTTPPTN